MRTYFEIATDGDHSRLIKKGKFSKEICSEQWEKIVRRNNDETGNYNYLNYKETLETYEYLLGLYHKVKLFILKLTIRCDYKLIEMLADDGYIIDKRESHYDHSLYLCSRKSDNLVTKIKSKLAELERYKNRGDKPLSFEQALYDIIYDSKAHVDRDITLAGYNQLRKRIKKDGGRNRQARPNN